MLRLEEGTHSYLFAPGGLAGEHELSLPYQTSERIRDTLGGSRYPRVVFALMQSHSHTYTARAERRA